MAISAITRFVSIQTLLKSTNVNSVVCTLYLPTAKHLNGRSQFSATAWRAKEHVEDSFEDESTVPQKPVFISVHMKRYLEKAKAHEDFMNKQIADYEIGLRHLANIMGEDVETIKKTGTQRHIQYLFPSGLYEKKARPILAHPTVLFPAQKEAEFDYSGRPHHAFFYTKTPKYYKLLHDMASWFKILNHAEDQAIKNRNVPQVEERKMDIQLLIPIEKDNLEKELFEQLSTKQYEYFLTTMERLIDHSFSKDAIAFITQYYKPKSEAKSAIKFEEVQFDENRRPFVKITNCSRKSTRGEVVVYGDGTGKIEINGHDILYFQEQRFREQCELNSSVILKCESVTTVVQQDEQEAGRLQTRSCEREDITRSSLSTMRRISRGKFTQLKSVKESYIPSLEEQLAIAIVNNNNEKNANSSKKELHIQP